jgi:hypothetical protein
MANEFIARRGIISLDGAQITGSLSATGNISSNTLTVTNGITGTATSASYVEYSNVAGKPALVSGSSQISFNGITDKPTLVSGSSQITYSGLSSIPSGIVSSSAQVGEYNIFATTGSNTFQANQIVTGSLFITQNLVVAGSSSIQYISSSVVDIADNIITVNAFNPGVRFGGLAVADSGSSPRVSGSILFDSIKDQWIFVHESSATTSSVLLMGPETYNDLGNETYLSSNRLPKGSGVEHLRDSNITDTGTVVSVNSNTVVTGSFTVITGSAVELQVTNIGVNIGSVLTDNHNVTGSLRVSGSMAVTGVGTFSSNVTAGGNFLMPAGSGLAWSGDTTRIMTPEDNVSGALIQTPGIIRFNAGGTTERVRITADGNVLIGTTSNDTGARLRVNGMGWFDGQIFSVQSNGTVRTSNADAAGMLHIRPNAGQNGYINFTENAVDDRWSIGITAADGNLYFRRPYPTSPAVVTISPAGYLALGDTAVPGSAWAGTAILGVSGSNKIITGYLASSTSGAVIGAHNSALNAWANLNINGSNLIFRINGETEAMRITSGGNVGIGTTNPSQLLEVVGGEIKAGRVDSSSEGGQVSFGRASDNATGWYIDIFGSTSTPALRFVDVSNSAVRMAINSSGNVGIGTDNPLKRLDVRASVAGEVAIISNDRNSTGDYAFVTSLGSNCNNTSAYHYIAATGGADRFYIYGNGTYTTVSDRRLKKDITKVTENYLDKVSRLNIVKYHWNEQSETDALEFGMIAQEVEELIPSIVQEGREDESGNKYKGIQSSVLPYILIKAIQELKAENDTLKSILQRNNIS